MHEEDISAISLLSWVPLVNSLSLHTLLHFLLSFRYVQYVLPNSFAFACVKEEAEEKSEDGPCKQEEIERREDDDDDGDNYPPLKLCCSCIRKQIAGGGGGGER